MKKYLIRRHYTNIPDFQFTNEVVESELDTREFFDTIKPGATKPKKIELFKMVAEGYDN